MEQGLIRSLTQLQGQPDDDWELDGIESKDLYMNYVQLLAWTVAAQNLTAVVGRGGGKSDGILAPATHRNAAAMPRSGGVALGTTYIQLLDRTLPALFAGLHRLGYVRDQDYWIRRFPDKKSGLLLPWNCPLDPMHAIFIRNGNTVSVLRLVSQDRPGTANGLSVDWIIADEVKFLNKEKLDTEVRPINRGNVERYGDVPWHHGETFTTDMPTTRDARWVFEAEEEANKPHNKEAIQLILSLQLEIFREKQLLVKAPRNGARLKRIETYEQHLAQLRTGLTHFIEASSFVNIYVLGMKYFREMFRSLPAMAFNTSILGKRDLGVENGFYPDFSERKHYYDAIDNDYLDRFEFGKHSFNDCRKDTDLDHSQPLVLTMDAGGTFNCAVASQRHFQEVRYLKAFGVVWPGKIGHVIQQFTEYYAYFYSREVTFVYDQTFVGTNAKDDLTYADEAIKALKGAGWRVNKVYTGKVPTHHSRYLAWGMALSEVDTRFPKQRFNRENTRIAVAAMQQAKQKQGKLGFEKDKDDEKLDHIDQHTTTHYTDAIDTAFWYHTFKSKGGGDLLKIISG